MTMRDAFFLISLVGGLILVGLGKLEAATLFTFISGVLIPSPLERPREPGTASP